MFLANSDYRKEYGNIGPVLTWLNLESKEEVDNLHRLWSASKANDLRAGVKALGFARVHRSRSGRQSVPRLL